MTLLLLVLSLLLLLSKYDYLRFYHYYISPLTSPGEMCACARIYFRASCSSSGQRTLRVGLGPERKGALQHQRNPRYLQRVGRNQLSVETY